MMQGGHSFVRYNSEMGSIPHLLTMQCRDDKKPKQLTLAQGLLSVAYALYKGLVRLSVVVLAVELEVH